MNIFKWLSPKKNKRVSADTTKRVLAEWRSINDLVSNGQSLQLRQALISADKTLDNVLRDYYDGTTMGERLIAAKDKFDPATYNKVWQAHKTRNALVHESGFEAPASMLKDHVRTIRNALYIFGIKI